MSKILDLPLRRVLCSLIGRGLLLKFQISRSLKKVSSMMILLFFFFSISLVILYSLNPIFARMDVERNEIAYEKCNDWREFVKKHFFSLISGDLEFSDLYFFFLSFFLSAMVCLPLIKPFWFMAYWFLMNHLHSFCDSDKCVSAHTSIKSEKS